MSLCCRPLATEHMTKKIKDLRLLRDSFFFSSKESWKQGAWKSAWSHDCPPKSHRSSVPVPSPSPEPCSPALHWWPWQSFLTSSTLRIVPGSYLTAQRCWLDKVDDCGSLFASCLSAFCSLCTVCHRYTRLQMATNSDLTPVLSNCHWSQSSASTSAVLWCDVVWQQTDDTSGFVPISFWFLWQLLACQRY